MAGKLLSRGAEGLGLRGLVGQGQREVEGMLPVDRGPGAGKLGGGKIALVGRLGQTPGLLALGGKLARQLHVEGRDRQGEPGVGASSNDGLGDEARGLGGPGHGFGPDGGGGGADDRRQPAVGHGPVAGDLERPGRLVHVEDESLDLLLHHRRAEEADADGGAGEHAVELVAGADGLKLGLLPEGPGDLGVGALHAQGDLGEGDGARGWGSGSGRPRAWRRRGRSMGSGPPSRSRQGRDGEEAQEKSGAGAPEILSGGGDELRRIMVVSIKEGGATRRLMKGERRVGYWRSPSERWRARPLHKQSATWLWPERASRQAWHPQPAWHPQQAWRRLPEQAAGRRVWAAAGCRACPSTPPGGCRRRGHR